MCLKCGKIDFIHGSNREPLHFFNSFFKTANKTLHINVIAAINELYKTDL